MPEELTTEQKEVLNSKGDLLVIAGPGTGKSFTLVKKIQSLLENGVSEEKILVLSYSVKVSQELKERLSSQGLNFVKVDTFHGLAYDIWRDKFGSPPKILSEKERTNLLKKFFGKKTKKLSEEDKIKFFEFLKKQGVMDFELLLYEVSQFEDLNSKDYYIIIDEFQDLSPDILNFLKIFKNANFVLFGDPNQSIYGFKGVSLSLLYSFLKEFKPDIKLLSLTYSFRCPQLILNYAEKFKASPWKVPKFSGQDRRAVVQGFFFEDPLQEKDFLVKFVKSLIGGLQLEEQRAGEQVSPEEIFVIARIKQALLPIQEAFQKAGIPVNPAEQEASAVLEKIKSFLEKLNTSVIPVEDLISVSDPELKVFLENLWELSSKDKEKFSTYLSTGTVYDFLNTKKHGVNFLSIHASKGLEAKHVILVGAEDGLIPLKIFKDADPDEEKRLLYVAITRSMNGFYFSSVKERQVFNFRLKGVSYYFKDFPLKTFKKRPRKPKQQGLFG
ncbi:MAG: ATP-dependent helicase [Thermodesulfobacteria bacterium]|nr:ATP-dependent helicase [Thermodesulfobacteriota bacterium]